MICGINTTIETLGVKEGYWRYSSLSDDLRECTHDANCTMDSNGDGLADCTACLGGQGPVAPDANCAPASRARPLRMQTRARLSPHAANAMLVVRDAPYPLDHVGARVRAIGAVRIEGTCDAL